MKKLILIISGLMVFATMAMGCSSNETNKTEEELIKRANKLIEKEYNVKIDTNDYNYSVGKEVAKNKFDAIKEGEIPKEIFVGADSKNEPKNGDVFKYSIKFNTETDEIISSNCEIY